MIEISKCPACAGTTFTKTLTCEDYTVSHETFQLVKCDQCSLMITSPQPEPSALGKYYESQDYISHSNSSKSLFDKLYQLSRVLMLNWKWRLVKKHAANSKPKILDYGCGTGHFLEKVKKEGATVTGIEPSAKARALAESLLHQPIFENIDQVQAEHDIITLWHVLEHVPDLNTAIDKLIDRLDDSGTIFIAVPNHVSPDQKKYQQHWAAYDVPRHLWHFNREAMKTLLEKHGLKIHNIIPMKLDALYVSILSETYRSGHKSFINLLRGIFTGLLSNLKASKTEYSSLIYVVKK